MATAISSIATVPPQDLYTYSGVSHPKSMEHERASYSINIFNLSISSALFIICNIAFTSLFSPTSQRFRKVLASSSKHFEYAYTLPTPCQHLANPMPRIWIEAGKRKHSWFQVACFRIDLRSCYINWLTSFEPSVVRKALSPLQ